MRFLLLAVTALAACTSSEPHIDDARAGGGSPPVAIYVVAHEGHTGIAVPRADIPAGLWPESRDFPQADYVEVGWGDRNYYYGRDQGAWGTLSAALWPTPSVLHVAGVHGPGFVRLIRYFDAAHERSGSAAAASLGPGLYGNSRFYPGWESFHIFRTCNVWTARGLRAAGLSIHDPITSDRLMSQAREIGKVVNEPRIVN
ncbi:MAG: DUF2459 domain-containing protein [Deltaproteobacteria bacterium]|nr:DUF2459 domain-containing protein [Deltaproteobacteria bacterium]